jgi:hypothetical protein
MIIGHRATHLAQADLPYKITGSITNSQGFEYLIATAQANSSACYRLRFIEAGRFNNYVPGENVNIIAFGVSVLVSYLIS